MRRERKSRQRSMAIFLGMLAMAAGPVRGAEVSGVVRMPEVCSPSVSPAVVYLQPSDDQGGRTAAPKAGVSSRPSPDTEIALVNQRGLQFTPRVQAIALGQTVRF